MFIRRDDVLPTTSTGEGTFYIADDDRSDNESDADPPQKSGPGSVEVALFSELEPVPTIPEDVEEGSDDEEEDLQFKAYSPLAHMYNVNLSQDDALEFPDLLQRRRDRTSSSLDSGELEVGKECSNKDSFLGALKQHSIMNGVNYNVVKSKSNKFEAKCVVQDGTCLWKIMASLRKKTCLWEIKKYKGPHTFATGVSEDHPKMNSDMLATLILPMVKADPRTSVPVLIANIRSQLRLRRHVYAQPNIYVISDGGIGILAAIEQRGSLWHRTHHRYCLRHVASNYYGQFRFTSEKRQVTNMASYKGQMQGGHVWCAKVLQEINKAKVWANTMHTVCHDRDNLWFRVTKFDRPHEGIIGGQYHVHLRNRNCDCGRFDALRYRCAYVITACQNLRLDPISHIDKVYKLETMYNMWRHVFPSIPDEHNWPPVSLALFKLVPDRELRCKLKGQPCSTRIRTNMDIRETTNHQKLCGWCRNPGHTSRSCPNQNS
ncbi:hypothetical protein PVK06_033797 [Gossypium arboreum]|uniref:Transposase MuDR plant domain-containing protein n=1 Tax=Gossypium arboreum TaxID=29729 RepID=A0ABR0NCF1_GOSAR|nr:hypothetical protein PVK06_033797 [Gossypium arboreum]